MSAFEEVQEISGNLKVDMNRERDLIQLLEKAEHTLHRLTNTMSEWIHFTFAGQGRGESKSTSPELKYSLAETLQLVGGEIKKPLLIIREFIDNLVPVVTPKSSEWHYVQAFSEELRKVELAVSLFF